MNILLNGESRTLNNGTQLAQLVHELGLELQHQRLGDGDVGLA